MKLLIPLAGLIDKEAELERLEKEIARLRDTLARSKEKLGNANFVDRAPAEVVAKERLRVNEMQSSLRQLDEQLQRIQTI